jgi:hypothetical protein
MYMYIDRITLRIAKASSLGLPLGGHPEPSVR